MQKIGKIIRSAMILFFVIILLVNISIIIQTKTKPDAVPSVFGYKPFIVLSGSMESKIKVGDLVIVKNVDANDLQVGDIIAFRDSKNIVTTHRIIEIKSEDNKLAFITKGDANNTKDDVIVYSNMVEGKFKTRIGKLGSAIMFIQQPIGFVVMLMSIFIICLLFYLYINRNINKDNSFKNAEERQAFEEFMKERKGANTGKHNRKH